MYSVSMSDVIISSETKVTLPMSEEQPSKNRKVFGCRRQMELLSLFSGLDKRL